MSTALQQQKPSAVGQHIDEAAWLATRRTGLGGSDIASIFGLNPYKSAVEVWQDKVGVQKPEVVTPDMLRGIALEGVAADVYAERTGRRLRRQPLRRHPEHHFLLASIDRQILAGPDCATGPCEIKCPRSRMFYQMKRGLPEMYILQGQQEAGVWGYGYTGFGIFGADEFDILTFDVAFEPAVWERIVEVAGNWWNDYVVTGIKPPEDATSAEVDLPKVDGPVVVRDDEDWNRAASEFFEARELEKEAALVKEMAKARLQELAGAQGIYEGRGNRFYWSTRPGNITHAQTVKAIRNARPLDRMKVMEVLLAEFDLASRLDDCTLDVDALEQRGKPIETFTGYVTKGAES